MPARDVSARAGRYLAAVLIATAFGSVVQTQFNAAAIAGLGVPIPPAARLSMTLHDLVSFTPTYGAIVAVTLLLALPPAAVLARAFPPASAMCFVAAGAFGLPIALRIVDAVAPMPTFVAATRGSAGLAAMAASAALGSAAYGLMRRKRRATSS